MGSKTPIKRRRSSPSPEVSDSASSEASSSRSAMEVEEATTAENSNKGQTSSIHSESDTDEDASSDDGDESDDASERPVIDAEKARKKLHHVAKQLRATAKKTKTFEVQKLVKKLKGLRKKDSFAEQAELAEQELSALKSIDTNLLAGRALITKLVKAKMLPRPADVDDADDDEYLYLQMVKDEELLGETVLVENVVANGDRAVERAKAKITSSKVLADEVGRFVEELKKLAGVEPKKEAGADVKGKSKAILDAEDVVDEDEREWSGSEEESDSEDDAPRRLPLVDDDDEEGDGEGEDEEELMRIGKEKLKALGDLSQWDDMIGSDSGVDSGSDEDEDERDNATSERQRRTRSESNVSDDASASDSDDSDLSEGLASDSDSDSDDDSESDSDSEASSTAPPSRKRKASPSTSKSTKKSKSSSSNFLPSLSTGFIAGRSDDEWSDAEADLADRDLSELKSGSKKERKNRMGQRARKALYEKKYGSNANHIKMREKKKSARAERAPTNAASGGGRQRPPAFQAPTKRDGGWGGAVAPLPKQPKRPFVPRPPPPTATPVQQSGTDKKQVSPAAAATKSQEMHPSWIAKQKQKELMAQVKPQGKKVVFD